MLKEPNLAKEAGQGLLSIVSSYARGDLGGMASSAMGIFKKATTGDSTHQRNLRTKTSPADVVMWSGSKDSQTSYVDPTFPDEPNFCFSDPIVKKEDFDFIVPTIIKTEEISEFSLTSWRSSMQSSVPYRDMDGNILI